MIKPKSGFLLVELMIGLSLSTFFMVIMTHYIIEVKVTQQEALKRFDTFSHARNKAERDLAKKNSGAYAQ